MGSKVKIKTTLTGIENLRTAIVTKAAQDYRLLLKGHKPTSDCNIPELESFFRGDWYKELFDVDGERIMRMIRDKVKEESKSE